MLNRDFEALTVTGKLDMSAKNILAGSPVTLGENGYKLATADDKVIAGLSLNYFCDFNDEVSGGDFHANSGKISVVKVAQVTLMADVYFDAAGEKQTVVPFTGQFEINDKVGVNADGKIVTLENADGKAVLGTVVEFVGSENKLVLDLMPVAA